MDWEPIFKREPSDDPRVTEIHIDNHVPNFAYIPAPRQVAPLIQVGGQVYIAAEIVSNIRGGRPWWKPGDVKYGPRARRHYCRLTEEMVEEFMAPYVDSIDYKKVPEKSLERSAQIKAFALALIDML